MRQLAVARATIRSLPSWSAPTLFPDGRWLAYQSDESGALEIYVRPFPSIEGGRWQISNGGGSEPFWSRDGRWLYYVDRRRSHLLRVEVRSADGPFIQGRPTDLGRVPFDLGSQGRNLDIHPDGRILGPVSVDTADDQKIVLVTNWLSEYPELTSSTD